ncbi:hypothetical protein FGO68_gene1629 [Halteria grandinella]|uniref:Uncharacterized protein n=1 Tax=Halteria grandinella TaxID=5974 RepID=A0A8J8NGM1_HALGN|nr:hypothetical protein FGO68_gene1629 [Halteria grandinella]
MGCAFLEVGLTTAAVRVGVPVAVPWRCCLTTSPPLDCRECIEVDYFSVTFLARGVFGVSMVTVCVAQGGGAVWMSGTTFLVANLQFFSVATGQCAFLVGFIELLYNQFNNMELITILAFSAFANADLVPYESA